MKFFTYTIGFVLTIFTVGLMAQTDITLAPVKDNTLFEDENAELSSGAGDHIFAGRLGTNGGGDRRRAVLAFELAEIPQGVTIESVSLTLNMSKANSGATDVSLHKLNADWGEGTSDSGTNGKGATATAGDATWNQSFFNTSNWATPGGDFEGSASAVTSVSSAGSYTWGSTVQMVADVQTWLDNSQQNFGWILIGDETTLRTAKRFDSKEHSNSNLHPQLTITYTSNTTSVSETDNVLPESIALAQNYPNPFNPATRIGYSVPVSEDLVKVKLEVFNLLGQKIYTLVDARQSAGSYSVTWDGRSFNGNLVSNGLYIYRLTVAGQVKMKSMTYLK